MMMNGLRNAQSIDVFPVPGGAIIQIKSFPPVPAVRVSARLIRFFFNPRIPYPLEPCFETLVEEVSDVERVIS